MLLYCWYIFRTVEKFYGGLILEVPFSHLQQLSLLDISSPVLINVSMLSVTLDRR